MIMCRDLCKNRKKASLNEVLDCWRKTNYSSSDKTGFSDLLPTVARAVAYGTAARVTNTLNTWYFTPMPV